LWFLFLPFIPSFKVAIDFAPVSFLDLYVLLSPREDIPHPSDFMLHQVFIKGVDLQPTDERSGSHIVIAVLHQGPLALKITDVMVKPLFGLHLDHKEIIVVLPKLLLGSVLVIESPLHLFETPE